MFLLAHDLAPDPNTLGKQLPKDLPCLRRVMFAQARALGYDAGEGPDLSGYRAVGVCPTSGGAADKATCNRGPIKEFWQNFEKEWNPTHRKGKLSWRATQNRYERLQSKINFP